MLNASDLKSAIFAEIANLTDAGTALQKLGNAIANYVKVNAEISFSWIAVNPVGGAPDPTTSAAGAITSMAISLTPSYGTVDHNVAQAHLQDECNAALSISVYNITDAGFSTAPAAFGIVIPLLLSLPQTSDSDAAIGELAANIVDWIKSQVPALPVPGTHGAFVGAGTVISIS